MVENIFEISSAALTGAGAVLNTIFAGVVAVFDAIVDVFK